MVIWGFSCIFASVTNKNVLTNADRIYDKKLYVI